jgi:hypothetical protein
MKNEKKNIFQKTFVQNIICFNKAFNNIYLLQHFKAFVVGNVVLTTFVEAAFVLTKIVQNLFQQHWL